MIQFDEHIFPMGWFNHQLVSYRIILAWCDVCKSQVSVVSYSTVLNALAKASQWQLSLPGSQSKSWNISQTFHIFAMKKGPLVIYIGDLLGLKSYPDCVGIKANHYKDPYSTTRIQWKVIRDLFHSSHVFCAISGHNFWHYPIWLEFIKYLGNS